MFTSKKLAKDRVNVTNFNIYSQIHESMTTFFFSKESRFLKTRLIFLYTGILLSLFIIMYN